MVELDPVTVSSDGVTIEIDRLPNGIYTPRGRKQWEAFIKIHDLPMRPPTWYSNE